MCLMAITHDQSLSLPYGREQKKGRGGGGGVGGVGVEAERNVISSNEGSIESLCCKFLHRNV